MLQYEAQVAPGVHAGVPLCNASCGRSGLCCLYFLHHGRLRKNKKITAAWGGIGADLSYAGCGTSQGLVGDLYSLLGVLPIKTVPGSIPITIIENRGCSIAWRRWSRMPGFEVIHENLQRQCGIVTSCQVHLIVELVQQQVHGQYDSSLPRLWQQPFIEFIQLRSGVFPD